MIISEDLIIKARGYILNTPTNDGLYDKNGHEYKYFPGMDFSPTDNVTKGNIATYLVNVNLKSKSNQKYDIENLTISAYDYPKNINKIKVYYINNNPDAMNTDDDNVNNYTGIDAEICPCIFKSSVNSFSSFTTGILVKIPKSSYWKTKISPKIKITAKNNNDEISSIITLPEIKIAPKANYVSNLFDQSTNMINYKSKKLSKDKIEIPFSISSYIKDINKITNLNNPPCFKEVEYSLSVSLLINGIDYKLSKSNFKIESPEGFKVLNCSYKEENLKIKIKGQFDKTNANSITDVKIIIPLKIYEKSNMDLQICVNWEKTNPVNIVCEHNYQILYSIEVEGNIKKNIKL